MSDVLDHQKLEDEHLLANDPLLQEEAERIAEVLRLLSQSIRLEICSILYCASAGGISVGEISSAVHRSQPNVSHHLGRLKNAGLVDFRSEGRNNFYFICNDEFRRILRSILSGRSSLAQMVAPKRTEDDSRTTRFGTL